MKNVVICAVSWLLTVGAAYWVGSEYASKGEGNDTVADTGDLAELRAENDRLREALNRPVLESNVPATELTGLQGGSSPAIDLTGKDIEPTPTFTLEGVETVEDASNRLMAYLAAMLQQGEKGHLAVLKTWHDLFEGDELKSLVEGADEESLIANHMYDWIRFAVRNDRYVVDLEETYFKTMATNPKWFEGMDDDPFEMFSEGIAYMLPSMTTKERMERFKSYATTILETPEERQPKAVQRARRDIQRLMRVWVGPISPEDALAKLMSGEYNPSEVGMLLGRVRPEDVTKLDMTKFIGPILENHDWRAMQSLRRMELDARTLDAMDRQAIQSASGGKLREWTLRQYLEVTRRGKWEDARSFMESGWEAGGKATDVFASLTMQLRERPSSDWVQYMLERHQVSDHIVRGLKQRFKLK